MSFRVLILPVLMAAALWAQSSDVPESTSRPSPSGAGAEVVSDLLVSIQQVGGKIEEFKDEIVCCELILDDAGRLDQVHLITRGGAEADTMPPLPRKPATSWSSSPTTPTSSWSSLSIRPADSPTGPLLGGLTAVSPRKT